MLRHAAILEYDMYRMNKQAISVTLSPDNLVWLRGRALAEGHGSLSEFLDKLVTRTRTLGVAPRPAISMRGALASLGSAPLDLQAIDDAAWSAWTAKWDDLLAGMDLQEPAVAEDRRIGFGPGPVGPGRPRTGREGAASKRRARRG